MSNEFEQPSQGLYFLATKLYIPNDQSNLVYRPDLIEKLEQGVSKKLTLLSTPAGFGKSTLVVNWIHETGRKVAWLALDDGDNDPTRFMQYLVKAIQAVYPSVSEPMLQLLQSPQPPSFQAAMTLLINALSDLQEPLILVLDDYHLIESQTIHAGIEFFVNNMPPIAHIFLTTRRDPPIGIGKLRANGELTELRAPDLSFSDEEMATYLNEVMGLQLPENYLRILSERTEGWIVGLKMAAFSIQGCDDIARRIQIFAGDDRYILDYLLEEVLEQQPEKVREFLLHTSILDRFNGQLCGAVTELDESQEILEYLESSNLFVVPLDNKRSWYRFHQLFGDLLKHFLMREQAEIIPELHRRATKWFEVNERPEEAVQHAFLARDFETACELIGNIRLDLSKRGQTETLLKWYRTFPKRFIGSRPLLSFWYAWALIETGRHHEVEGVLRAAERQLPDEINKSHSSFLQGEFAMLRSSVSLEFEELERTIQLSEFALKKFGEEHEHSRCVATGNLGVIYYYQGDLEKAVAALSASIELGERFGTFLNVIWSTPWLGLVRLWQGKLIDARELFEKALQLISEQDLQNLPAIELAFLGMARLLWLQGNLVGALDYTEQAIRRGELGKAYCLVAAHAVKAGILLSQNKLDDARQTIALIDNLVSTKTFSYRWSDDYELARVRLAIKDGRCEEALRWVNSDESRPSEHNRPQSLLLLAELLVELQRYKEAASLAERVQLKSNSSGWKRTEIDALIVGASAWAYILPSTATDMLTQAVATDVTAEMGQLFADRIKDIAIIPQASRILHKYKQGVGNVFDLLDESDVATEKATLKPKILDNKLAVPLSEREQQVLTLINDGATNNEIAEKLCIALSTVKTHINNIYGKFGVRNRTQALRLAREMHLV